jgi:hypothetical protein
MNSTASSAEHAHKDGSLLKIEDHAIDLNHSVDVPKCSTGRDGTVKPVHQDTLLLKDIEDVFQLHNAGDTMNTMVMLTAAINAKPVLQDGLQLLTNIHVLNTHQSAHVLKCSLKTMDIVNHAHSEWLLLKIRSNVYQLQIVMVPINIKETIPTAINAELVLTVLYQVMIE